MAGKARHVRCALMGLQLFVDKIKLYRAFLQYLPFKVNTRELTLLLRPFYFHYAVIFFVLFATLFGLMSADKSVHLIF